MNPLPPLRSRFSNYSTEVDPDDAASVRLMQVVREELNASLSVIYSEDCPLPEEIRDPWLERVVDMSTFFDNLQNKHRSLRPQSGESEEMKTNVYEQTLSLGKEIERDRHIWLSKLSAFLFRKKNASDTKPHLNTELKPRYPTLAQSRDKALPPRPHTTHVPDRSSPAPKRLRRTPALRELSTASQPIDVIDAKSSSTDSLRHRRIVSDPHQPQIISPQPRKPFFNPFLTEVQGSIIPSIPSESAPATSTPSYSGESSLPPIAELISRSTMSAFRSSSDSSSLSSLEYTTAPTTPRIQTPRTKSPLSPPKKYIGLSYDEAPTAVYYSPLDHLRLYPRLDPHGRAPHTPEQAVLPLSPKRHASPLKAQTVTVRGRYQSLQATKVTHPSTNECRCKHHSKPTNDCKDDIAFLPSKPRLLSGEGYFHSRLVDETETEGGDTVQTWRMYPCDRCNRQSRPPAREDVVSILSSNPDDYDAYSTATEDFDENLGY